VSSNVIQSGVDTVALARALAYAAAWRMARFAPANDLRDWFTPMHAFSYCHSLVGALHRCREDAHRLLPGLLHGAMAVFQDRFLNEPAAYYPETGRQKEDGVGEIPALENILQMLDQRPQLNTLVRETAAAVRAGQPLASLVDTFCWGTVREDLDFHFLQVLEAAADLARTDEDPERQALYFVAVARHLGSHCPTARARRQSTDNAIKLHR